MGAKFQESWIFTFRRLLISFYFLQCFLLIVGYCFNVTIQLCFIIGNAYRRETLPPIVIFIVACSLGFPYLFLRLWQLVRSSWEQPQFMILRKFTFRANKEENRDKKKHPVFQDRTIQILMVFGFDILPILALLAGAFKYKNQIGEGVYAGIQAYLMTGFGVANQVVFWFLVVSVVRDCMWTVRSWYAAGKDYVALAPYSDMEEIAQDDSKDKEEMLGLLSGPSSFDAEGGVTNDEARLEDAEHTRGLAEAEDIWMPRPRNVAFVWRDVKGDGLMFLSEMLNRFPLMGVAVSAGALLIFLALMAYRKDFSLNGGIGRGWLIVGLGSFCLMWGVAYMIVTFAHIFKDKPEKLFPRLLASLLFCAAFLLFGATLSQYSPVTSAMWTMVLLLAINLACIFVPWKKFIPEGVLTYVRLGFFILLFGVIVVILIVDAVKNLTSGHIGFIIFTLVFTLAWCRLPGNLMPVRLLIFFVTATVALFIGISIVGGVHLSGITTCCVRWKPHGFPDTVRYPICDQTFGSLNLPAKDRVKVVDLALLARDASCRAEPGYKPFDPAHPKGSTICAQDYYNHMKNLFTHTGAVVNDEAGVQGYVYQSVNDPKMYVMALASVKSAGQWTQLAGMWLEPAILNFADLVFGKLDIWPVEAFNLISKAWSFVEMDLHRSGQRQFSQLQTHTEALAAKGQVVITGYALSGAIAKVVGAYVTENPKVNSAVLSVSFAGPGLSKNWGKFGIKNEAAVLGRAINVNPENNVLTTIGGNDGYTQTLRCDPNSPHKDSLSVTRYDQCYEFPKLINELVEACQEKR